MKILFKGNPTPVEGTWPKVDAPAPNFTIYDLDDNAMTLDSLKGKTLLISTFPNIDTSVCDRQTRRFYELASEIKDVKILNLSNNAKENLSSWCATNGIDALMVRDADQTFAQSYGIWLPEINHLARATFVIDKNGQLVYSELVPEVATEPNYDAAIAAAHKA